MAPGDILLASSTSCDDPLRQVRAIDLQSLEYLASSPRTDVEGAETPLSICAPFSARVRIEDPGAVFPQAELAGGCDASPEDNGGDALPQSTESIPIPMSPRLDAWEDADGGNLDGAGVQKPQQAARVFLKQVVHVHLVWTAK